MASRSGSLSKKTFWPNFGDMLEDEEEGICWEAARMNKVVDEVSGETIKFGLLLGRHPDFDEPIEMPISSKDSRYIELLDTVDTIHRKKAGGLVPYRYNEATETWRSQMGYPQVIHIFKRLDGHPVSINSDEVAAIDTCINPRGGLVLGSTIVLKNGKEFDVEESVPAVTGRLFPLWLA